ncbi:MAG: type II secretion system F family protein [Acidimicrobiia bacterium]
MTALVLAASAALGTYLLYTAVAFGWRGVGPRPDGAAVPNRTVRQSIRGWLAQAGLAEVAVGEFAAVVAVLAAAGSAAGFVLFGSPLPAVGMGAVAASAPVGLYRNRRRARLELAAEEWPRLLDEIRLRATTLGRSVPQALFEVGDRAPAELRPAFAAAQREWRISTDFARTLDVLRTHLGDPTADVVCETLLIAHDLGGTDLGPRLLALAEDRRTEVTSRKDARARQAGVRFARRFVLVVPLGMAAAGSLIGTGRHAYTTPTGQALVLVALTLMGGCWWWAGHYLRLPAERRVFPQAGPVER